MRTMLAFAFVDLCGPTIAAGQVTSSENLSCTVGAGGMACNGIGAGKTREGENKSPKLFVTRFILEPGAVLEQTSSSSDFLIIGINGGGLLNEKAPLLHVSLEKDSVALMPKEQPFRLRNKGSENVEFQLIEIRR
jgi:hypothetical protein